MRTIPKTVINGRCGYGSRATVCQYGISVRQACRVLRQWRGTQRYQPQHRRDEDALTRDIIALASEYGRYGTGGSPRCCRREDGRWARTGCSASGGEKD